MVENERGLFVEASRAIPIEGENDGAYVADLRRTERGVRRVRVKGDG